MAKNLPADNSNWKLYATSVMDEVAKKHSINSATLLTDILFGHNIYQEELDALQKEYDEKHPRE
jgi:hypothetical protein